MKKILMILFLMAIATTVQADWMGYYTTSDNIRVPLISIDTLGRDLAPDSIHLVVHYHDEATANSASYTARFATAGAGSAIIDSTTLGGKTYYYFFDAIADIDNGEGDGSYACELAFFVQGEAHHKSFSFGIGNAPSNVLAISNDITAANNAEAWFDGTGYNSANSTIEYVDTVKAVTPRAIGLAQFDTAAIAAYYGFAIWVDAGASNTNTTVGVDGTPSNPVSTLTAARVLADSINVQQYNILNASSLTLAATHEGWFFCGIGHNNLLDLGSQDVDDSQFDNLTITGTQAGTGTINLTNCDLIDLHDFDGEALFCWLVDSLVMDNNSSAFFGNCYSEVAGNGTPTIDFHIASNNVAFRNYSGGINIVNMSDNDKLSIEGNGQIIVDATCTSAPITARGNFTITDNGTTTAWTRQAVFNWGDMSDTDYDFGIWIDDGAANTNTTAYVDGTKVNPVSTLAAARTLADAIGFQKYYLINNSSLTLAATHEDWVFTGIGRGNSINLGDQDADNSDFYNLMITGTQGGTGVILLDRCYLNTPDSLEAIVTRSSLSDTISLRVSTNTVFDQCYSHIAGNASPGLDFNSTGTIDVDMRHYSGGLTLFNMTSDHTISYESDGQLVIDASCTSANVTARGNMTITDNGTTTALTDDAVFNITQNIGINWNDIDNPTGSTPDVNIFTIADGAIKAADFAQGAIDSAALNADAVDEIVNAVVPAVANYPDSVIKMVVKGTPTTTTFQVGYISPTVDYSAVWDGMLLMPITGNARYSVVNVANWDNSDSTFIVRPGFGSAPNVGDTVLLLTQRGGIEPTTRTQYELLLSATGRVRADSVETRVTSLLDSVVTNAITDLAIAASFSQEVRNFIWANMDTALFPTDSSDFIAYLTDRFAGSVSIPDSVLGMVPTLDSVFTSAGYSAGISILEKLGGFGVNDRGSTDSTAHVYILQLLERLGPFGDSSVASTPFTLFYWIQQEVVSTIDSILTSLGFDTTDLHTKIDNLSLTGGGSEPETLIVKAAADSSLIQGARITVRTIDQSTVKVPGLTTDVNGKRILELDVDSFVVAVTANNYVYILDTIVVASGGQTDIIYMTLFDPGSPAEENETRVYGWIYGDVANVEVVAKIPSEFWPISYEDEAFPARRTGKSDGAGYWFIDLVPNSLLSDTESVWEFSAKHQSEQILGPCQKEVLDSTSQKLVDCEAY